MDKLAALRQYFGFSEFRAGQQTLIDAVLSGRDALGIMPTGGGKSLCYELPALLLPGITLVVSPLISLMKDQVMALRNAGIPAGCINSSMSLDELRETYRDAHYGAYKLLYVAPERLLTDGFCALAQELEIPLVAVDEAHCISQWGQDFRPSYLKIVEFLQRLPHRPAVAAFTATATAQVRADIIRILQLHEPETVVTGFDRPNLRFEVLRPKDKRAVLLQLLAERRDKSGIVYCATRKTVEQVCGLLQEAGFAATRYHAGLDADERRENQEAFICDRSPIMAATNAFGMGIDKSNVSYVIHYNMPKSLEAYYQEAGRAGRDGSPADCILLYSPGDVTTAKFLIFNSSAENEELTEEARQAVQTQDLARLESMTGYCKTQDCLRGYLLDYFGQPHEKTCSNCGNCQADYETQDLTREAQMILSCVVRARNRLGYCVGSTILSQTLHGGRAARVRELGLDTLPTYGLMSTLPSTQIREWIELLERAGYLEADPVHGGIDTTPKAASVLFSGEQVLTSQFPQCLHVKFQAFIDQCVSLLQAHVIAGNAVEQIAAVPPCIKVYPHFFVFLNLRCNNFPESVLVLQRIIVGISVHRIKTMHQCRCGTDSQMRHSIGALVPANRIIDLLHQILDFEGGDRVKRGGGFIHQQNFRLYSQSTCNAQALVLSA